MPYKNENFKRLLSDPWLFNEQTLSNAGIAYEDFKHYLLGKGSAPLEFFAFEMAAKGIGN